MVQFKGFPVDVDGRIMDVCACNECLAGQNDELEERYGEGHFACSYVDRGLLKAWADGTIINAYVDSGWAFFVSSHPATSHQTPPAKHRP